MNSDWFVKVEEREKHLWPGTFVVTGWYQDEKDAYKVAEAAWEKKRPPYDPSRYADVPEGCLVLEDDHFSWIVETPWWFLHCDCVWRKTLMSGAKQNQQTGVFPNREAAIQALNNASPAPARFANYVEHLQSARDPVV